MRKKRHFQHRLRRNYKRGIQENGSKEDSIFYILCCLLISRPKHKEKSCIQGVGFPNYSFFCSNPMSIIIMKDIKDFFQCCGYLSTQPEVVITMQQKRRAQSCTTPGKTTYIKRSIGKHPILELSPKDTNSSTIHTIKNRQSLKINRIVGNERRHSLNSSHDVSIDFCEKMKVEGSPNNVGKSKQIHQFINFKDHKERYTQERLFGSENEKLFELNETQAAKIAIPRLLHGQRSKRQPQITKIRLERPSPRQKSPHMLTMRTILQTIQQRSSIPSLEQSHLLQMHQIASKATLKSNIYDKTALTPLTEKYESMIFQTDRSRLSMRMANSQNLSSNNIQTQQDFLSMVISKLTMDNRLLERQYNALKEEQSFLITQKQYDLQQFQQRMAQIQHQQSLYISKMQPLDFNPAQPLAP